MLIFNQAVPGSNPVRGNRLKIGPYIVEQFKNNSIVNWLMAKRAEKPKKKKKKILIYT